MLIGLYDWLLRIWAGLWLLPVILLFLVLGGAFAYTEAGRFVSSPTDAPVASDVVVALGGEALRRGGKAGELWRHGLARRIFLAGPVDARVALLAGQGVPAVDILTDGRSRHSWDEAVNTFRLMTANGWTSVLVVSDPPHMRRLAWTWEHVFVGSGMTFRLIPAPMPGWDAGHWWRDAHSAAFVKSELGKLVFYLFRYGSEGPEFDLPTRRAGD